MEPLYQSATRLAKELRNKSWYHRTTCLEEKIDGKWYYYIVVWGEGNRPEGIIK